MGIPTQVCLAAALAIACGSHGFEQRRSSRCTRMWERLAAVGLAGDEARFVRSCVSSISDAQIDCVIDAPDAAAVTGCTTFDVGFTDHPLRDVITWTLGDR